MALYDEQKLLRAGLEAARLCEMLPRGEVMSDEILNQIQVVQEALVAARLIAPKEETTR